MGLAFSQAFTGTDLPLLDLMTSAKSYSSKGTHDTYSFLHLTIQEYLGAFWAAKCLSDSEKVDFLRKNLKNERFYMVLWFFAGITKLNIPNVHSVFNHDLWEYDNHVHICHLLHESDPERHSLCSYVANNCISKRDINLLISKDSRKYSRFDCLMIARFLAHSSCQWNQLVLNVVDVLIFHKVFSSLKTCHTAIQQVTIEVDNHSINGLFYHEGTVCLLDEIPQFSSIKVNIVFVDPLSTGDIIYFKNLLTNTKAIIKSMCVKVSGAQLPYDVTRDCHNVLIEGIADSNSLVTNLELKSLTLDDFEHLISLFIKWNSYLKLVTLSASKNTDPVYNDNKRCHKFCNLLSIFLSKNRSLRKIDMTPPFDMMHIISYADTLQSGLDQNFTLEELIIGNFIVFQRNKHTSNFELVNDAVLRRLEHSCIKQSDVNCSGSQCVLPQLGSSSIQTQCRIPSRVSESPFVDALQAPPSKRLKIGNPKFTSKSPGSCATFTSVPAIGCIF